MHAAVLQRVPAARLKGVVVIHRGDEDEPRDGHEAATRAAIARELAAVQGFVYAGDYDGAFDYPGTVYHVPRDTVIGERAKALGIESEADLFGGVAPHTFVATKSISHGLAHRDMQAPEGWSHAFADEVVDDVLPGFTAFSLADAITAASRLLTRGPVRVKRSLGIGGRGQTVARDIATVDAAVRAIDALELATCGVVIEHNLVDVVTFSVGQVRVGAWLASYVGTQRETRNNSGHAVYGGSTLLVARGDFDALLELGIPADAQAAIGQARRYHAAALEHYRGVIVSRRNYDVAQGRDAFGAARSGVLEQSWRLGGASGAETAALGAFARDASLMAVEASTVETYGDFPPLAEGALVHYRDIDPRVGALTKVVTVKPHVDAR
jgi:hypothetical protein